jgi:hypothetical protein
VAESSAIATAHQTKASGTVSSVLLRETITNAMSKATGSGKRRRAIQITEAASASLIATR